MDERCDECGGLGEVTVRCETDVGGFLRMALCLHCGGSGWLREDENFDDEFQSLEGLDHFEEAGAMWP